MIVTGIIYNHRAYVCNWTCFFRRRYRYYDVSVRLDYYCYIREGAFLIQLSYLLWFFRSGKRLRKCWFSESRLSKIDQNKNQNLSIDKPPESGKRKKVNMQNLLLRFRSQQVFLCKTCGEIFYPNLWRFVWRRHARDHPSWCRVRN